jgi:hypothetical protein
LSFSPLPDLIILGKLIRKLTIPFIVCLLGVAILSNRFLMLRQFIVRLNHNVSFQLPVDNAKPWQADRRTFLVSLANEGIPDLQQLPRDAIRIKTDLGGALRDSRVLFKFQTDLFSRPPSYILDSVLNL